MTATVAVNKKFTFRSRTTIVLWCVPIPFHYRFFTVPILYQKTVVPFSIHPTLRFFSPCEIDNSRVMVFSSYMKQRIVFFRAKGYKAPTIKYSKRTELIMHNIGSAHTGHRQG